MTDVLYVSRVNMNLLNQDTSGEHVLIGEVSCLSRCPHFRVS